MRRTRLLQLAARFRWRPGSMSIWHSMISSRTIRIRSDWDSISPHQGMQAIGISQLLQRTPFPIDVGPLQYDDVDIGEALPARCVREALWISNDDGLPFAVLIGRGMQMGMPLGIQVDVATPGSEAGIKFSEQFFDRLEKSISTGRTYRGKVISLEMAFDYTGRTGNVQVHRLRPVRRADVILPEKTVALLENNLTGFIGVREQIRQMGTVGQKRASVLRPSRHGKDAHHPLPG
jgi:hypothetical protein